MLFTIIHCTVETFVISNGTHSAYIIPRNPRGHFVTAGVSCTFLQNRKPPRRDKPIWFSDEAATSGGGRIVDPLEQVIELPQISRLCTEDNANVFSTILDLGAITTSGIHQCTGVLLQLLKRHTVPELRNLKNDDLLTLLALVRIDLIGHFYLQELAVEPARI